MQCINSHKFGHKIVTTAHAVSQGGFKFSYFDEFQLKCRKPMATIHLMVSHAVFFALVDIKAYITADSSSFPFLTSEI